MQQFRSVLAKMCEIVPNLRKWFHLTLSVGVSSSVLPMEQHGDELDNDDGEEKEHEDDSNGFKVQVLFGDDDLGNIYYRTGL